MQQLLIAWRVQLHALILPWPMGWVAFGVWWESHNSYDGQIHMSMVCHTVQMQENIRVYWFIFASNPGSHSFMFVMICFTVNLLIHFTSFIHFNFSIEVKHCLLTAHGSIKWQSVYPQRKFQVSSCWLLLELKVDNCWELHENKKSLSDCNISTM